MKPRPRWWLPGRRSPVGRERLGVDPGRVLGGHRLPELKEAGAELLEDPGGEALTLVGQAEQQVLGADAVVADQAGLLLGVQDRALGRLGHAHRPTSFQVLWDEVKRVRVVSPILTAPSHPGDSAGIGDAPVAAAAAATRTPLSLATISGRLASARAASRPRSSRADVSERTRLGGQLQ
jgi:hypothetical protein